MAGLTPMMQQYLSIKEQHPDSILFFRLGDFYEMFADDAKLAAKELDLALTSRDHGKHKKPQEEQLPMCGVPYHASEAYIARLIAKGYKVAICEQTEDPAAAKGLVQRDVVRVVTPGTVLSPACLEEGAGNYLCGIYLNAKGGAAAFCDLSTGQTHLTSFPGGSALGHIINELGRFHPAEAILSPHAWEQQALLSILQEKFRCRCENGGAERFRAPAARRRIRAQFGKAGLDQLASAEPAAALALGGLLSYLQETQKTDLSHINHLDYYRQGRFMELDLTARRNLELTETLRGKERRGSLLWVLDRTRTPMGARLLRSWLERPLLEAAEIRRRSAAVAVLVQDTLGREELSQQLTGLGDMERTVSRIVYGSGSGRDAAALHGALARLPELKEQLARLCAGEAEPPERLGEIAAALDPLEDLSAAIAAAVCDEPPLSLREGGIIREGYHPEVDRLRSILKNGRGVMAEMESREKEKTGIRTLKIGYNKVFGYYIEVSNTFRDQVPEHYIRKQTLVNGERFITQELKDLEQELLTAGERLCALEYELFADLRQRITAQAPRIQAAAAAVAEADALASLASAAVRGRFVRPEVDESGAIEIREGRHPVVERMLTDTLFVPNDTCMGQAENRVAIITGPNMAGKSTYMRQVALIVLMTQIGSFVPASYARIGVVDRIFTRIGASDDLSAGQSTFMVEMTEVAELLRQATDRSLLILDEIGRGTSTFDGMAIARAVLEHCAGAETLGAKTLFATHYHELTALADTLPGAVNYSVAVRARGDEIVFLRKIVPGGADRSYGVQVARLAGLPQGVVDRAKEILQELEAAGPAPAAAYTAAAANGAPSPAEEEVLALLRRCAPETLSPLEAMELLFRLKKCITPEKA